MVRKIATPPPPTVLVEKETQRKEMEKVKPAMTKVYQKLLAVLYRLVYCEGYLDDEDLRNLLNLSYSSRS